MRLTDRQTDRTDEQKGLLFGNTACVALHAVARQKLTSFRHITMTAVISRMGTRRKSSRPRRDRDVGFTSLDETETIR